MKKITRLRLDADEWLDNDDLVRLLEDRVKEKAPENMPRFRLLEMVKYLNIVSDRHASLFLTINFLQYIYIYKEP